MIQEDTPTSNDIANNTYVDNVFGGCQTVDEAKKYYSESKQLFGEISMNIREWYSNSEELQDFIQESDRGNQSETKVLGLKWDVRTDELSCCCSKKDVVITTKRHLLQFISSVHDPCGLFAPVIISAKLLVQVAWKEKISWDSKLSQHICENIPSVQQDLQQIGSVRIPRLVVPSQSSANFSIHCFCDASAKAYAAACYLRVADDDGRQLSMNLIFSKARLAPIKPVSIPRLELMAAVVGVRITAFVVKELRIPIRRKVLWSDSMCVLQWINSSKILPVFVQNRVKEISAHHDLELRYVPTECNPADLSSRGSSLQDLEASMLWWHGPQFLVLQENLWPEKHVSVVDDGSVEAGEIATISSGMSATTTVTDQSIKGFNLPAAIDLNKFSNLRRLLNVSVYVMRFIRRFRRFATQPTFEVYQSTGPPSSDELIDVQLRWAFNMQAEQRDVYKQKPGTCRQLDLFYDENGLLRCGGRLQWSDLLIDAKHPILLPKKSHFGDLVIRQCHEKLFHAGVRQTLAQVRLNYWIPTGASVVKRCLKQCRICRRMESGPFQIPRSPPYPNFRVCRSHPFEHVGIDYLGPLYIRRDVPSEEKEDQDPQKVWLCLITCASTRAIHLEVVTDASTDQFIMCLRRFSAFYGQPTTIISDNAKQFKSAENVLKLVSKRNEVQTEQSNSGVNWKFITELAPWMGGFYERLIGSVKRALRKSLGSRCLSLVELQTVVLEISAVLNSRPLVSNDSETDDFVLTPAHFLAKRARFGLPAIQFDSEWAPTGSVAARKEELLQRWKKGQRLVDQFWNIWKKEYLTSLRERAWPNLAGRNCSDIEPKPGVVVLIKDDLPRCRWKLGRIKSVEVSSDGRCRSAMVQLPSGMILKRAIRLLYPLVEDSVETESTGDDVPVAGNVVMPTGRTERAAATVARNKIRQQQKSESGSDSE